MLAESAKLGQVAEALKSERVLLKQLFAQFIEGLEVEARSRVDVAEWKLDSTMVAEKAI